MVEVLTFKAFLALVPFKAAFLAAVALAKIVSIFVMKKIGWEQLNWYEKNPDISDVIFG